MPADRKKRQPLRSSAITREVERATHRSLLYSMGWHPVHLQKGSLLERYRRAVGSAMKGCTLE